MGFHDREYYKDESSYSRFESPSSWSMTTYLVVVTGAVYLLNILFGGRDGAVMDALAARPETLYKPYLWWQWLTYGFAHSVRDIGHILWNMFALWIFGRPVEGIYGPKEFLRIYLVSVVLGGLFWSARTVAFFAGEPGAMEGMSLVGASGAVTAVTLLFCLHYPKQTILFMFVLPMPAWALGALIITMNVFYALAGSEGVAVDVHLVGAVFAIAYFKLGLNLGRWSFSLPNPKFLFRRRPRLRVHRGGEDEFDDQLAQQADKLLEKINREGIDSLTDRERRLLEKHSRRMRERRGSI